MTHLAGSTVYATAIPPEWDRAVAYGDGLFETIVVFDGKAPLWPFHIARLQDGCRRLQIHCDLAALQAGFEQLAASHTNVLIKIIVARSGGQRGYDSRSAQGCAVQMSCYPLPRYPALRRHDGIRLHLCRHRITHNPSLAGIKHLNRLEQVRAASEWDRRIAEEGLMLDADGTIIEGTISNLFVLHGNILVTPSLEHCGVAGVMRAAILQQLAPAIGVDVQQCRMSIASLLAADSAFVCNSVFGIWPVKAIGVSQLSQSPVVTGQLWEQLAALGYTRLYG